jgi:FG-GAP-like repeat
VANRDPFSGKGSVIVLLGNGDGTFQAAQSYAAGPHPSSVAVADFNGDGIPDLAVASQGTYPDYKGTVSILLGNGDGTFQAAQSYAVGAGFRRPSLTVGDFNGDGTPDLAVASFGTSPDYQGTVSVLLGNGDGTFQAAQTYAAGSYASSVAVGDFNADGSLDLAVGNASGVSILLGNGDGTFQAAQSYAAGGYPISIVVGDFNGNGYPDLAVADYSSNTVTVLMNAADWGGRPSPGPAAVQTRGPFIRPLVPNRAQLRTVATSLVAWKAETAGVLTFPDLPPRLVLHWPPRAETGQPVQAEAAFIPRPMLTIRHARDAVFERWGDSVLDETAWDV